MDTREMVAESNRIEGIQRPPTDAEIIEHERFVRLKNLSVSEIENYVRIYQPNARLRSMCGLNVIVGAHTPPAGGNLILAHLRALVTDINAARVGAWDAHLRYETLLTEMADPEERFGICKCEIHRSRTSGSYTPSTIKHSISARGSQSNDVRSC